MIMGRIFNTVESKGLIILRLGLGVIFIAHGGQKLFGLFGGSGLEPTLEHFQHALGIPAWLTYLAVITEFFGGLAVLIGILTRLAAMGLCSVMLVAMVKVHLAHGFFLNWSCQQGVGHGLEFNLALFAMALTLAFSGPGLLSLDYWLSQR